MAEILRVRRANVELDISPFYKDKYLAEGYSILDIETGEVIEENVPKDVNHLIQEIKRLKNYISELEAKLDAIPSEPALTVEELEKLSNESEESEKLSNESEESVKASRRGRKKPE